MSHITFTYAYVSTALALPLWTGQMKQWLVRTAEHIRGHRYFSCSLSNSTSLIAQWPGIKLHRSTSTGLRVSNHQAVMSIRTIYAGIKRPFMRLLCAHSNQTAHASSPTAVNGSCNSYWPVFSLLKVRLTFFWPSHHARRICLAKSTRFISQRLLKYRYRELEVISVWIAHIDMLQRTIYSACYRREHYTTKKIERKHKPSMIGRSR